MESHGHPALRTPRLAPVPEPRSRLPRTQPDRVAACRRRRRAVFLATAIVLLLVPGPAVLTL
jgi:hypothetical protein